MGYYTAYKLEIEDDDDNQIIGRLREENEEASYALDENGDAEESCKWYEHNEDLIEFSTRFPEHLFTLHGEGEEAGDLWRAYFKNGKSEECRAEITYRPFVLSALS